MGDTLPPSGGGMPWKECHIMDERLRFVARLLEGEKMAPLCAEFGISRKTGYKIFDRYKDCGVAAFTDRSRRPYRQANRLPAPLEAVIVRLKREYPGWGAPKIREKLRRQFTVPHLPAISTVHAVLDRHGLDSRASLAHCAMLECFDSTVLGTSNSGIHPPRNVICTCLVRVRIDI